MPKLTTLLGWGVAKEAGEAITGRGKNIETALSKAQGKKKKKKKKPKGTFDAEGEMYLKD